MIYKESTFSSVGLDGQPLMGVLDTSSSGALEKVAGIHPEVLKFKQMLEPEPDKTYVHILALGAGDFYGPNLNNDHFPWAGLSHDHSTTPHPYLHGYKTFLNAHSFAHHVNKDPAKSYGDVILSTLNHKMKRVELIVAIDHARCEKNGGAKTLQKIHDGQYPATSMGCRVPFDVCSICGNKAKTRADYCEHMKLTPGKILEDGRKVFVYNHYPRFFDISFVFIGADRTSFVLEKIASKEGIFMPNEYEKIASAKLGKTLRGGAGVRRKSNKIRKKNKVARQSKLSIRPITFGKINTSVKESKKKRDLLLQQAYSPNTFSTVKNGPSIYVNRNITPATDVIEKTSEVKLSEAEKISEIFKRVKSLPMGRAVPMRVGREADIPEEILDQLGSRSNLRHTLGDLGSAGIVLKPKEFQRVSLVNIGKGDLARDLHRRRVVFRQGVPGTARMGISVSRRPSDEIFRMLGPLLEERSTLGPVGIRRISIMRARPMLKHASFEEIQDPVLDKLSSAYDSYRTSLIVNTEELIKSAMHSPVIRSMILKVRGIPFDHNRGIIKTLGMLPLAYFTQAYWKAVHCCGMTEQEFLMSFTQNNPEICKYLSEVVAHHKGSPLLFS